MSATPDSHRLADLADLPAEVDRRLAVADLALAAAYAGMPLGRQPVHTVYVPADRFDSSMSRAWGRSAVESLAANAGTDGELAAAWCLSGDIDPLRRQVLAKLTTEPIEDLRIDFEDGYGHRPDAEEDLAAETAATSLAEAVATGSAGFVHGIRVKSLEPETRVRSLRTLELFLATLVRRRVPLDGFVTTLPKVTSTEQVATFAYVLSRLESALDLPHRVLRFELQVETPESVLGAGGNAPLAPMIRAGEGRVTGLHYGTYDYSAAFGVAPHLQSTEHPVADHAKAVMQVAAAGTGVFVSDGSSNVLPVGRPEEVRSAWRLHARLVRRSLAAGIPQGWDLHPAQLVSRYAATFAFFRDGLPEAAQRLRAATAKDEGRFLDEPATVRAMTSFLVRGLDCGALGADEVEELSGLSPDGIRALVRPRAGGAA